MFATGPAFFVSVGGGTFVLSLSFNDRRSSTYLTLVSVGGM